MKIHVQLTLSTKTEISLRGGGMMGYVAAFAAGLIFGAVGIVVVALNCTPGKKEEDDIVQK